MVTVAFVDFDSLPQVDVQGLYKLGTIIGSLDMQDLHGKVQTELRRATKLTRRRQEADLGGCLAGSDTFRIQVVVLMVMALLHLTEPLVECITN